MHLLPFSFMFALLYTVVAVLAASDGKNTGIKGGGGIEKIGSGDLGDNPPLTPELFPDRSGFNARGSTSGKGDSSRQYTPNPMYYANAKYKTVKYGQKIKPYKFASHSPAIYYASNTRSEYSGAWGYGYYLVYPYPHWAYGSGIHYGSMFLRTEFTRKGKYITQLRNMTVVNSTNVPLFGDQDIFNNGKNIVFTDSNIGVLSISPCGQSSSSELQVADGDCSKIVLDIAHGVVVSGNAEVVIEDEVVFFRLNLGNATTTLRTVTISSTKKEISLLAVLIIGAIFLSILLVIIIVKLAKRVYKRMRLAKSQQRQSIQPV